MLSWDAFLPEVAVEIGACPRPLLINAIQNAGRKLIRDSRLLTEDLPAIDLVNGVQQYAYDSADPANFGVVGCDKVWVGGELIDPLTEDQAESETTNWLSDTGVVVGFVESVPGAVRLVRIPDVDTVGGLVIRAAVVPKKTIGNVLPEWFVDAFLEDIAAGAKARLMLQPGTAWANPQMGAYYQTLFEQGISKAATLKSGGAGRARTRTRSYPR